MSTLRLPYYQLSATALAGLRQCKQALEASPLGLPLIELVYLRISQINGCSYCLTMHADALRSRGETQQRLDALAGWHASALFSLRERAALQWAEALTALPDNHAADADYQPLATHFSAQEVSDLTFAVALMNAFNRLAVGMRQ
ncbi:carboxymuconolactone decarboxylase family protein [Vogesella oryzae]|uniref:carboxymuconolactone decarboxylase family protein n=1 Tax=Vogesella oryzae TaxID=1735285 RepID=UPI00158413C6|nr:carboxymuconolactone decarboxylase family protein [Vogesella oryzae]